ncbi:citramalyl-CoA lyase, mitochondrial [Parasteatoda tepidariorum]|uniref:citramalyl-CoA lyase, mitochondrial n=1 Tax=Parasteatoda tepidariorum TaxID=114398 RepID=UPI001C726273|nr:citramalyl-CoA lyase, mitochondrial [Parasteatoda tepidariorum]
MCVCCAVNKMMHLCFKLFGIQKSLTVGGKILFYTPFVRTFHANSQLKIRDSIRPRRAMLYVPGHDQKKIGKLNSINVDCAVLDCEDGVAANMKADARRNICEMLQTFNFGKTDCAVRINSVESGLAEEDLIAILKNNKLPDTLVVPKLDNPSQLMWLNDVLRSHLQPKKEFKMLNLLFLVESAISLLNLRSLCAKAMELSQEGFFRLEGLIFGADDFCADIGANRSSDSRELVTSRQMFVIYAKAFKIQAIDMVHINYKDLDSLKKYSEEGANMGFTGKQVIHPMQVPVVQKAFSPSEEKIEWATELIKLFKIHQSEGKGAFIFRGNVIDKPLLLQAEYIIKMSDTNK